eukprot:TRINITY_DN29074_c0_g1_i1.p2 TRINITY_DN29074_c0_g1~~TRINITY_DN29074_c0_g1_i1.p2  ORF type:complete len:112 (+),score=34.24 TRINITY_DN29074_c0_g1_i1:184-519(+)
MRRMLGETSEQTVEVSDAASDGGQTQPRQQRWSTEEEAFVKSPDLVVPGRLNLPVVAHSALLGAGVIASAMIVVSKLGGMEPAQQPETEHPVVEATVRLDTMQAAKKQQEQ